MQKIHVNTSVKYDVLIGEDLLSDIGEMIQSIHKPCRAALITDDKVDSLYGDRVRASLEKSGFSVCTFAFPNGEQSKTAATFVEILEFLASQKLTRGDLLIALGGGVAGDITGFAASAYLRGLPFVQIPTTFLAAIDSSVGGKTGINLKAGKNLAGAFHQPSLVICDCRTFDTLPPEVLSDGIAEGLKYGVICDKELFYLFQSGNIKAHYEEIVSRCVAIKRDIVQRDEFDKGDRQLLNLGHTIGHAIEKCSDFAITHGIAVGIGLAYIARATEALHLNTAPVAAEIEAALLALGLSNSCPYPAEDLLEAALSDKKRFGGTITLVIPKAIGESVLYPIPVTELLTFIKAGEKP